MNLILTPWAKLIGLTIVGLLFTSTQGVDVSSSPLLPPDHNHSHNFALPDVDTLVGPPQIIKKWPYRLSQHQGCVLSMDNSQDVHKEDHIRFYNSLSECIIAFASTKYHKSQVLKSACEFLELFSVDSFDYHQTPSTSIDSKSHVWLITAETIPPLFVAYDCFQDGNVTESCHSDCVADPNFITHWDQGQIDLWMNISSQSELHHYKCPTNDHAESKFYVAAENIKQTLEKLVHNNKVSQQFPLRVCISKDRKYARVIELNGADPYMRGADKVFPAICSTLADGKCEFSREHSAKKSNGYHYVDKDFGSCFVLSTQKGIIAFPLASMDGEIELSPHILTQFDSPASCKYYVEPGVSQKTHPTQVKIGSTEYYTGLSPYHDNTRLMTRTKEAHQVVIICGGVDMQNLHQHYLDNVLNYIKSLSPFDVTITVFYGGMDVFSEAHRIQFREKGVEAYPACSDQSADCKWGAAQHIRWTCVGTLPSSGSKNTSLTLIFTDHGSEDAQGRYPAINLWDDYCRNIVNPQDREKCRVFTPYDLNDAWSYGEAKIGCERWGTKLKIIGDQCFSGQWVNMAAGLAPSHNGVPFPFDVYAGGNNKQLTWGNIYAYGWNGYVQRATPSAATWYQAHNSACRTIESRPDINYKQQCSSYLQEYWAQRRKQVGNLDVILIHNKGELMSSFFGWESQWFYDFAKI